MAWRSGPTVSTPRVSQSNLGTGVSWAVYACWASFSPVLFDPAELCHANCSLFRIASPSRMSCATSTGEALCIVVIESHVVSRFSMAAMMREYLPSNAPTPRMSSFVG